MYYMYNIKAMESLPKEITTVPLQLVALVGLDTVNIPSHKSIWDTMCVNRRPGADRLPLYYKIVAADHVFPKSKQKVALILTVFMVYSEYCFD